MSRAAIKKNQEAARDLADTVRKFMSDMAASGIGADSPTDSPMTFPYATSNDEYKGDDEGDGDDDYELDNNCEYIPVNESEDEEKEELNYLEDKKKGAADEDQQSPPASKPPARLTAGNSNDPAVAPTFSTPESSRKTPVAPTHTPKKRKIPAAMLGSGGSNATQATPLRRSSRTKHKTSRYTNPVKEEPVKTERPPATHIAGDHVMADFTRLMPKMVCKHCDEEVLVSRGVAQKHLESCSVLLSKKIFNRK